MDVCRYGSHGARSRFVGRYRCSLERKNISNPRTGRAGDRVLDRIVRRDRIGWRRLVRRSGHGHRWGMQPDPGDSGGQQLQRRFDLVDFGCALFDRCNRRFTFAVRHRHRASSTMEPQPRYSLRPKRIERVGTGSAAENDHGTRTD